ncbi:MAG: N-acetylmuramoyl-L-alanine amidase [Myxococcales bacterium]
MPWGIPCALACVLFTATAAEGEPAAGGHRPRPLAAEAGSPAAALQARRLEKGELDFERLTADARRKRRRDTWELVIRELDGAFAAAPKGPRAREAATLLARAREELWSASRRKADGAMAIEAYRGVDERFPGSAEAADSLSRAVTLAGRVGDADAATSAARRLAARYPGTAEAAAAATVASFVAKPDARANDAASSSATASPPPAADRAGAPPNPPPTAKQGAVPGKPSVVKTPPQPPRADPSEPAPDEVAAASRLLDSVIDAARKGAAAIQSDDDSDESDLPPEPEAPEPVGAVVVKQAVPPADPEPDLPEKMDRARELRSTALSSKGGSLAEQLGLKIRRVVVDAGHGGRDTGAIGPKGTREKDVALSIAKVLAKKLEARGFAVVLTREDDRYLTLDERTRIANDAHADLFVSIHCNAARRRKLSGIETWTLNVASNRYATRLAAFENADTDRSASDLRLILADLATRANTDDSRDIAQSVQSALVRAMRSRGEKVADHGIKHALFYVLLGARMPAILVETGFISNPVEEARLRTRDRQRATAEAIAAGVREFADGRQRLARFP